MRAPEGMQGQDSGFVNINILDDRWMSVVDGCGGGLLGVSPRRAGVGSEAERKALWAPWPALP